MRDWRKFRYHQRPGKRHERAMRRFAKATGWRRTVFGIVAGAGITLAIAEALWRL